MKTITNSFRDALRGIRQLNARVTYISGDTPYILTTENNYYLDTENNFDIGTEKGLGDLESDKLYGINPVFDVPLLKTICKSLELESEIDISIGTEINAEIGVLVGNDYEYINFGKYYVKSSIYQLDTQTYKITCYDAMADSMVKYDDDSAFTTLTIGGVLNTICSRMGWTTSITNDTAITDVWRNQQMTYRDILDELCSILGNLYLTDNKELMAIKPLEQIEVSETITDEDMKDTSVDIGKQVEITKAMVTQNDVTLYEKGSGDNAYKFDNNHLLMAQPSLRETACDNIVGLTYYPFDIETIGLLIYDPLDKVTIEHDNETYTTYILKDDVKYQRGLEERIETIDELSSINGMTYYSQEEKATRDAVIEINKANGQIVLKANSDGKIVQASLETDADSGSSFNVKADNINLEGYTTINDGFSIDENGNMSCNDAKINGGDIDLQDDGSGNASLNINDVSSTITNQRQLAVGDDCNGLTLHFSFLNVTGDEVGGIVLNPYRIDETTYNAYFKIAEWTNGFLSLRKNYMYGSSASLDLYVNDTFVATWWQCTSYGEVDVNLTQYTMPNNIGKLMSFDASVYFQPSPTSTNYSYIKNLILADIRSYSNYTRYSSSGFSIIRGNNSSNYTANGISLFNDNTFFDAGANGLSFGYLGADYGQFIVDTIGSMEFVKAGKGRFIVDFDTTTPMIVFNDDANQVDRVFFASKDYCYSAGGWQQGSREELKKNIKPYKKGLDEVLKTDIYSYNLKIDDDNSKKRIGCVIGDKYSCSKDIINKDDTGIDLYSMISVSYKAIQEQQEEIEKLKKEIEQLKKKV